MYQLHRFKHSVGDYGESFYKDGALTDGPNGEPAVRSWDSYGRLRKEYRYTDGYLHDSNGKPALQEWDENGRLVKEEHYKHGVLHADDIPAVRHWDSDGRLVLVEYCKDGVVVNVGTQPATRAVVSTDMEVWTWNYRV